MWEGDDHEYAVAAHNIIVGKVRGKEITVCQGDKSNASMARVTVYRSHSSGVLDGDSDSRVENFAFTGDFKHIHLPTC